MTKGDDAFNARDFAAVDEVHHPPGRRPDPDVLVRGGSQDPVDRVSDRISPARPHIGPLALLGRRALEVPQGQEAHDPSGGEDRAG
jgi:hypothetical protein